MTRPLWRDIGGSALLVLALMPTLAAEVVEIEVEAREVAFEGREFGEVGAYEKLTGRLVFAVDPQNDHNRRIRDLDRAPRDDSGRVRATANFLVLRPAELAKGCGTALLEVSNRGGKASLGYFNQAPFSRDPTDAAHAGDGFLMRRGLTVIWVGWQFDVPAGEDRLRLEVPRFSKRGLVRSDWVVNEDTTTLALGHRGHDAYPALGQTEATVLTERDGREAPRRVIPHDEWQFAGTDGGGDLRADPTSIHRPAGFEAGKIYELVYESDQAAVVGLGLAAIRDTISFARHDERCPFPVQRGLAVGISQTGRFLRHFVYQAFNVDEQGRPAFDGLLIHTAGAGRGSFNHRFAQPSRDAHRYSAFFYPTDIFPFSGRTQNLASPMGHIAGLDDGLLKRQTEAGHVPRIFYTNTGYEYWGRAASLIHTTLDGKKDVELLPQERLYHLSSTQHFRVGFPPPERQRMGQTPAYRGNPIDFLMTERALLVALQEWVEDGREPPPSTYPRIDAGTLVPHTEVAFPAIPGVRVPTVIHTAYDADYGHPFRLTGVIVKQPPVLHAAFPSLVSQVDPLGHEVAGVPTLETLLPLATHYPWNLREGLPGETHELTDFYGTFVPLPRDQAERRETGDPRPSLDSLYDSRASYLQRAALAFERLVGERWLLEEDRDRVMERATNHWDWTHDRPSREAPR